MSQLFDVGGARLSRLEDARLVTGAGCYASDWSLPGQLHAFFLRSDRAHARIVSIDVERARRYPGVARVYTGADAVRAGYVRPPSMLTFKGKGGMMASIPERPVLAHGRVRFVGEAVAMVVAESALVAQDAADFIAIEYEDLPVVIAPEAALAPGAPKLHNNVTGNLPFEHEAGDAAATGAALAAAAHITRLRLEVTRVAPSPMEPRACVVMHDMADDTYTVHVHVQGINTLRKHLSLYTGVPEDRLKVIARDVGGGFGQRNTAYPEYCMQLLAARETGRPVKWVSSRSEGFLTDTHGRANYVDGALALDRDGKFLGMRVDWIVDMGAYLTPTGPVSHIRNPTTCLTGVYRIPALYGHWRVALTNTNPVAAYRGAGRPDVAYVVERLVDQAAVETGMDVVELRRRNLIPPEAFPYRTPTGSTYEYADLPGLLDKALALAGWKDYPKRRARSEKKGLLRGIGIATVIENTGNGFFPRDEIAIEANADGTVAVSSVSHSQGQGHETTFAMIAAKALGVPAERVLLRQGDEKSRSLVGNHSGGSRTMVGAGSVCHLASLKLIEHGKSLAAEMWGLEPSQVDYRNGEFRGRDGNERLTLAQLAARRPFGTTAQGTFTTTFPNGCHIAEVEIDPDTGAVVIAAYHAVDDCGVVINHTVVEGQIHGAVAQGAGQVLGEKIVYDEATGQLLTGSFMDYCMPRAGLLRNINMKEHPTPSRMSPLGVKGTGEAGCTASLPALSNAVLDALRPFGVRHMDMPFTPGRVWRALFEAKNRT